MQELKNIPIVDMPGKILSASKQMLLVKIAKFEFEDVLKTSADIGLVAGYDHSHLTKNIAQFPHINSHKLFHSRFPLKKELRLTLNREKISLQKAYFNQLGDLFYENQQLLGSGRNFNKERFCVRSSELPKLYRIAHEYRNIWAHPDENLSEELVSPPKLFILCGAILSILDLSSPKHKEVEADIKDYKKDVDDCMKILADEISETEDSREEMKELKEENQKLHKELEDERKAMKRLERQLDEKASDEEKILRSLDDASDRIIEKFEITRKNQSEESDSISEHIAEEFEKIGSKLNSVFEIVHSESQKIIEHVSKAPELGDDSNDMEEDDQIDEYEDEEDDFEDSGEEEDGYEDDEEEEFDEDEEDDIDRLTPLMAEAKLRALRDKIRREMGVEIDPWENICMIRPIVSEAITRAQYGDMNTIDDWKDLRSVEKKYRRHRAIMDRQLDEYGEEMMDIYRSVERR